MKYILTCCFFSVLALAYSAEQSQINPDKRFDRKNRRHGVWEFYHDGNVDKLASKGTFRHGYQVKTWTYYDTLGRLEKVEKKAFYAFEDPHNNISCNWTGPKSRICPREKNPQVPRLFLDREMEILR